MAVDIGPKIGIDGEKEFRQALQNINQQLKTLGSEMKAVTSSFDEGDRSEEALAAQTDVLNRQIDTQKQKLSQLEKGLSAAVNKYGEADTRTLRWAQAVNDAKADLNKFESQLESTTGEVDDLDDALDDAEKSTSTFGDTLKGAFLGGAIVGAIQSIVSGISGIVSETAEYRRIMASLQVSSEQAGYSASETSESYKTLFGVLGDTQTAATTTANLQAIGLAQDELQQLTNATIGAWATYGDSIPIDSLAEAINETIKVGKVTGTFADALNWAGVSEDEFNAKLEAASSSTERAQLVLEQLASQGLAQAGEAWQQNNSDIVAVNQATANLTGVMSQFGQMLSPIVANAKNGFAEVLSTFLGVVQAFQSGGFNEGAQAIANVVSGVIEGAAAKAPEIINSGLDMLHNIVSGFVEGLPEFVDGLGDMITALVDFIASEAPNLISQGGAILGDIIKGIIQSIPELVAALPQIVTSIGSFFVSIAPELLKTGAGILTDIVTGIKEAVSSLWDMLKGIGQDIIDGVKEGLSGLKDAAIQWGKDLIDGFVFGIKSKISDVVNTVKDVAQTVKDYIGFSEPDKGPLSHFHTFAPDMMQLYSSGIRNNSWRVTDAVDNLAGQMMTSMPTPVTAEDLSGITAGAVNGITAANAGQSFPSKIVLTLENGVEIARWLLPDLRTVQRANPEVVSGV